MAGRHGSCFRGRSFAVSVTIQFKKQALTSRIPFKELTVDSLAAAIADALSPGRKQYAAELGQKISSEVSIPDRGPAQLPDFVDGRTHGCCSFSFALASREYAVSSNA